MLFFTRFLAFLREVYGQTFTGPFMLDETPLRVSLMPLNLLKIRWEPGAREANTELTFKSDGDWIPARVAFAGHHRGV